VSIFVLVPLLGIPAVTYLVFKLIFWVVDRPERGESHESDGGA